VTQTSDQTRDRLIVELLEAAEFKRDRLIDLVSRATQIPSVSGEEGDVARFFEQEARQLGFEVDSWTPDTDSIRAHPAYVPVEYDYDGRNNVIAKYSGSGSGSGKTLALYGHIDTVPVDPNTEWVHDPYGGDVEDNKIFGRGSADMKGGCCVALVALEILKGRGVRLAGDVEAHLILDEEAGGNGTIAAAIRGHYTPSTGVIMLEPSTPQRLLVSNRGAQFFRIKVPGEEGGVEYHRDLQSAIDSAIFIIEATKRYAQMRESVVDNPLYEAYGRVKVPLAICRVQSGAWPSTVPGEAVLEGTIECLPGEDIRQVTAGYERYLREATADHSWLRDHPFSFETFGLWFEAAGIEADHEFVQTLVAASERAIGITPNVIGGGGSDLRIPVLYGGSPTVLWGPGGGPIHSVDEWVDIDQLVAMLKAVLVAAVYWCDPLEI
jgi:acetylornithine deacetylase